MNLRTKVKNMDYANDSIGVNGRHYDVDAMGLTVVHSADVATLRDLCGFDVVGQVDEDKQIETRLPATKEEFLDLALAIGLTGEDLRSMAELLDPQRPPAVDEMPEPVTTYMAPVPESQREVHIPKDDESEEKPAQEAAPADQPPEEDEEVEASVSLSWTKQQLLGLGAKLGLPVKPAMNKLEIFNTIRGSQT